MSMSDESPQKDSRSAARLPFLLRLLTNLLPRNAAIRAQMSSPLFASAFAFVMVLAVWQIFVLFGAHLSNPSSLYVTALATAAGVGIKASRRRKGDSSNGTDAA